MLPCPEWGALGILFTAQRVCGGLNVLCLSHLPSLTLTLVLGGALSIGGLGGGVKSWGDRQTLGFRALGRAQRSAVALLELGICAFLALAVETFVPASEFHPWCWPGKCKVPFQTQIEAMMSLRLRNSQNVARGLGRGVSYSLLAATLEAALPASFPPQADPPAPAPAADLELGRPAALAPVTARGFRSVASPWSRFCVDVGSIQMPPFSVCLCVCVCAFGAEERAKPPHQKPPSHLSLEQRTPWEKVGVTGEEGLLLAEPPFSDVPSPAPAS